MRRSIDHCLPLTAGAQKFAELSSSLADTWKAMKLRHQMQECLMSTNFILTNTVRARDLFGVQLERLGIREQLAPETGERFRCLTDGRNRLRG